MFFSFISKRLFIFIAFLSLIFSGTVLSQTTTTVLTSSGSFVVPCGVTTLTVQCWGAGGGGGGGFTGNADGGGGGGGGGYSVNNAVTVTSGATYNYTVGAGGTGGAAASSGSNGGNTTAVFGAITVNATGGTGGTGNTTGGATAGGTGGTGTFNGGNGGAGSGSNSGGGGEGASSTAAGTNASAQTAGSSGGDGGDGAAGSTVNTAAGSNGSAPGGGGSGGTKSSAGGDGGSGQIIITYATPTGANAGTDQFLCNTTSFALSANLPSGFTGAWSCVTNCTGISFSNSSSATSNVNGVPANTAATIRWTLTHSSGCTYTDNVVVTNTTTCTGLNDNCANATPFPAIPTTGACATLSNQSTSGTTNSNVTPSGACTFNSGTPNDDVWFSFVATSTSQILSASWVSGNTDVYWQVFSGSCASTMNSLLCTDTDAGGTITGLTIGQTYYIRLYAWSSTGTTTQNICLSAPPPPPANDNPCGATAAPVNSTNTCTVQTAGTISGATSSTVGLGSCFGTADDDVWFSFVATNSTQYISLNNVSGSTTDLYHSVYSGNCGSIGAALICSDPNNSTVTGLTVGNTYYIRVYSYTSSSGQTTSFSLCITPPATPPSNDNPCNATSAPVNSASGTCTVQTAGTVAGATSSGVAMGSCFGTADDDVWYSFVATSTSMNLSLNNVSGSTTDLYHSVYAGSCGSPGAALICSDPNSSTINGLTVGNTYYVRIYSYTSTSGQTTTFSLCLGPTPPTPTNTSCSGMQPFCSGSPINFQAQAGGGSAPVGPDYGCLSTTPNPTWFYLEIANAGSMSIDLTAGSDVDFAIWGPYNNLAAAQSDCGSYPAPIDCSYSSSNVEQMNIASVATGQVYVVLVTNYANVVQSITLNQATGATATTNCAIVLPISLLYFHAIPDELKVILEWETAMEKNNDYFEVEKSLDASSWTPVIRKQGKMASSTNVKYSHRDENPYPGISYYRLKQVDKDQTVRYSTINTVDLSRNYEEIGTARPNPFNDIISFDVTTKSKSNVSIQLLNYAGELVFQETRLMELGFNSSQLSLSSLRKGVYLLKITIENSGKTVTQKIIKN